MHEDKECKHTFVKVSSILTGFSMFELYGTGLVEQYYNWLIEVAPKVFEELVEILSNIPSDVLEAEQFVRAHVMSVPDVGDVARALIKLWYLGQWDSPNAGGSEILSASAYTEGLVWKAIDAHPQGAKEQGYGAWAMPPNRSWS